MAQNNGRSTRFRPGNTVGFRKGQSGNPGGRPRGLSELKEAAISRAPDAIETLVEIARGTNPDGTPRLVYGYASPRLQMAAAIAILDRAFGKPAPTPLPPLDEADNEGEPPGPVEHVVIPAFVRSREDDPR